MHAFLPRPKCDSIDTVSQQHRQNPNKERTAKMPVEELSDFEKQRLANIAERDQLLKKLKQEAQSSGLALPPPPRPTAKNPPTDSSRSKKRPAPRKPVIKDESAAPRRVSSRLRGLAADSEVAKRKADEQQDAIMEAERAKKVRKSDSFSFNEMVISGQKLSGEGLIGVDVVTKGVAKPYERTFGDEDIQMTTDKDLKAAREEMSGLQLWEAWGPNRMFPALAYLYAKLMMCRYQVDPRANLHNDLPPLRNETIDLRGRQTGPPGRSRRIPREARLRL